MTRSTITINRAPVLTLWASIVAERLGFDRNAALTLGKAVAGLTAQSKGRHLGVFKPRKGPGGEPPPRSGLGEEFWVELCGRPVPAKKTEQGIRAVVKDKPVDPEQVEQYLAQKFGEDLARARKAMERLARSLDADGLADRAFALYERFRPSVPPGTRGWGAKGELDLEVVRGLVKPRS